MASVDALDMQHHGRIQRQPRYLASSGDFTMPRNHIWSFGTTGHGPPSWWLGRSHASLARLSLPPLQDPKAKKIRWVLPEFSLEAARHQRAEPHRSSLRVFQLSRARMLDSRHGNLGSEIMHILHFWVKDGDYASVFGRGTKQNTHARCWLPSVVENGGGHAR